MNFFTIVYDYVFILQLITVSAALLIIFYPFKRDWKNLLIAAAHFIALFAVGTLLNWGLFELSRYWRWLAGINFHLSYLFMIAAYLCISKIYLTSRLILGATIYVTVIAICDLSRNIPVDIDVGIICIICYAFIVAFSLLIRKYSLAHYSDIPVISVTMIAVNAVVFTLLIYCRIIMSTRGTSTDIFYTLSLAGIYVLSVSSYLMIYFHCNVRKQMTDLQVENKLLEADKQMLVLSEQAISEMKALRHDIKNQYKVMSIMLEEERYDDLKSYFNSMNESSLAFVGNAFIDCGNLLINSIINMEILKANSYGVQLSTKINVPEKLSIGQSDLCRILVNLIDNAIEGILRTSDKDYLVDCKIATASDYLYICVQNEIKNDADRNKLLQMNTVKEDTANHGFGHRIVKKIAEKYNGTVSYSIEENEFIAEVMLDLERGKEVLKHG